MLSHFEVTYLIINLPKEEGIHKRQSPYKVSAYKNKNTKPKYKTLTDTNT